MGGGAFMFNVQVISVFNLLWFLPPLFLFLFPARKQEIIKMTEQLIEAINNGDFEAYT